jgi:uncharacterized Zn finger protein
MNWDRYGRTIKVEGGIRAQSARGAIGTSWWSKRFIAVLEALQLGGRLTRGRSYARAGQVLSLEIKPGTVTARVQGSRSDPYKVKIGLTAFPDGIWSAVEQALAEQAIYSARLLAGEMPHEIEELFAGLGLHLFPTRIGDLNMECSCPDWSVPCKHVAATLYLLAEAFDADPFQILLWRGRDRETLLSNLRRHRGGGPARKAKADTPATIDAAMALTDVHSAPLDEAIDRFWIPAVPLQNRPPTLDTETDLLLRQLATPPSTVGGAALVAHLRDLYRQLDVG